MSSSHKTLVTLTGTHIAESTKAIRFRVDSISGEPLTESKTEWFPLSQVEKITIKQDVVGEDILVVSEWICKAKELL